MFSMLAGLLSRRLCSALPLKNARLECLGYLVVSMLRHCTVHLVKVSAEAAPDALNAESLYRRFRNFFQRFAIPFDDIARLVVAKLPRPECGWILLMGRTNWKCGRIQINLPVVAIVVGKVLIPLFWIPHADQEGHDRGRTGGALPPAAGGRAAGRSGASISSTRDAPSWEGTPRRTSSIWQAIASMAGRRWRSTGSDGASSGPSATSRSAASIWRLRPRFSRRSRQVGGGQPGWSLKGISGPRIFD
jgi:hypothetical protein